MSTDPSIGVVGGVDREKMSWWRNASYTAIKTGQAGNLTLQMEQAWRRCIRNGGAPDFILAGSAFLDAYRQEIQVVQNAQAAWPNHSAPVCRERHY